MPYLQTYYCTKHSGRWLLFTAYLVWMLVLFYALSEIAETFLVPAVEVSFSFALCMSCHWTA